MDLDLLDKNKIISTSDNHSELIIESLMKSFDGISEILFNLKSEEQKEKIQKDESYKDIILTNNRIGLANLLTLSVFCNQMKIRLN